MKVVVATGNPGKLAELQQTLLPLDMDLVSQSSLGIESAAETGATFVENALDKARHASRLGHCPAIADDSGLVVPALNGEPGIRSARYAGDDATDALNNRKLIDAISHLQQRPKAYFFCALVYLSHPEDPTPVIAQARWHGRLLTQPQGDNGFGYDPLFFLDQQNCTSAQLSPAQKNALSHRGQAVESLCQQLHHRI